MTLDGLAAAVAFNARAASGLQDAKAYRPETPASGTSFWVEIVSVAPSTIGGRGRWNVKAEGTLWTQGAWDRSKTERLYDLWEAVWLAIESDTTLGGHALTAIVEDTQILRDQDNGAPIGVRYDIDIEA